MKEIYEYKGYYGCHSKCGLYINGNVVIVEEIDENKGTSVTNAAEKLATEICQKYNIAKDKVIWIEKYTWKNEITYDIVDFEIIDGEFKNPSWRRITKDVFEKETWWNDFYEIIESEGGVIR